MSPFKQEHTRPSVKLTVINTSAILRTLLREKQEKYLYRFVICAAQLYSTCPENVASFSSVRYDHYITHDITLTIMKLTHKSYEPRSLVISRCCTKLNDCEGQFFSAYCKNSYKGALPGSITPSSLIIPREDLRSNLSSHKKRESNFLGPRSFVGL